MSIYSPRRFRFRAQGFNLVLPEFGIGEQRLLGVYPAEFLPMEDEVVGGDTFRVIQEKGIQGPLYGIEVNHGPIIRKRNVSVCADYLGRLGP